MLQKAFNLPITFRNLNEELATPNILADYIDNNFPKEPKIKDNSEISGPNNLIETPLDSNHPKAINANNIQDQEYKTSMHKKGYTDALNNPPIPGARLGRDEKGNPVWYIADPEEKGKYIKVDL